MTLLLVEIGKLLPDCNSVFFLSFMKKLKVCKDQIIIPSHSHKKKIKQGLNDCICDLYRLLN